MAMEGTEDVGGYSFGDGSGLTMEVDMKTLKVANIEMEMEMDT